MRVQRTVDERFAGLPDIRAARSAVDMALADLVGKLVGGNRVSAEVEIAGLDVPEMGVPGYPEFLPLMSPEAAAAEVEASQPGSRSR